MRRLTRDDVISIVGHLDDWKIAEIIATGARREDLLEAFTRLSEEDDLSAEVAREPTALVARLCNILTADEPAWMDPDR